MDMDDARRASEEIYRRIRQQAGLSRSGSVGDITLQPEPLGDNDPRKVGPPKEDA